MAPPRPLLVFPHTRAMHLFANMTHRGTARVIRIPDGCSHKRRKGSHAWLCSIRIDETPALRSNAHAAPGFLLRKSILFCSFFDPSSSHALNLTCLMRRKFSEDVLPCLRRRLHTPRPGLQIVAIAKKHAKVSGSPSSSASWPSCAPAYAGSLW